MLRGSWICSNPSIDNKDSPINQKKLFLWAVVRWLSCLDHYLVHQKVQVWFPVRAHNWIEGLIPGQGTYRRQHIHISLSRWYFFLPLSKINKHILGWGFFKKLLLWAMQEHSSKMAEYRHHSQNVLWESEVLADSKCLLVGKIAILLSIYFLNYP